MIILAGDVGGTKTLLVAEEIEGGKRTTLAEERYQSAAFADFSDMLLEFMKRVPGEIRCAGLGVAGAVVNGHARGTNIPWELDEAELRARTGIPGVALVNDFAATARGVLLLGPEDMVTLQAGVPEKNGAIGILGAGTGLGEAILSFHEGRYFVVSTEAGHADFGARTDEEIDLLRFLRTKFGRVSYERVVSGQGIANIYEFVCARSPARVSAPVAAAIAAGEDPAAAVTEHAGQGDPLCGEALDLFVQIYGAEAGNVALRAVATAGVYLAGGVAPRMVERFQTPRFLDAFRDKGRHRVLVERVPVHLITNTKVGLLGAISLAEELARKGTAA